MSSLPVTQVRVEATTLPRRLAMRRGRPALLAAVAALAGFIALFVYVRAERTAEIDLALTLRLQARRHRSLALLMQAASWPGFPPQSRVIPPMIMAGLWLLQLRLEAAFQLLAWGTAGLSSLIKDLVRRPRPLAEQVQVAIAPLGGSSFPSGHVITYVGTYGFAAYLAHTHLRPAAARRATVAGLLLLIGLVGPSRVYQGHHWPTDVSASYLLGLSYLIGLTLLYRRVRPRVTEGR